MAQTRTVKLQVDATDAIKDLKKVRAETDVTYAELRKTTPIDLDGTKAKRVLNEVKSEVSEAAKGATEIGKNAEQSSKGFNVLNISVKAVGTSLKAAGIGLVVTAFVKLGEALSKNQPLMDAFNVVTESVSIAFQKFVNAVVSAGQKIGPFVKKAVNLTAEMSLMGKAIKFAADKFKENKKNSDDSKQSTIDLAKEIVELRKQVRLQEAEQRKLQLTYQKEAELQRQVRDDTSLTIEERIAANEKLGNILNKQLEDERFIASEKIRLAELELSKNKDNVDLKIALTNAEADLAEVEERITSQRSENKINETALEQEFVESQKQGIVTLKSTQ